MPADSRQRRLAYAALTVVLLGLTACTQNPNSIFHARTEFNRDVSALFKLIIGMGTAVFVFTEVLLLVAIVKFRAKPGAPRPEQVHGNTKLEILWTVIPAVVLAIIAVPTVQTIFKTQALSGKEAVQVQVIGHQWWWEFRYPQYNVTTANEVYLPLGKTIAFTLNTDDVIHSFWIPGLGGKRDAVYKTTSGWLKYRQNHIWFTADSTTEDVFNGFCAEYCGTSHANMRFRAMTVTQANFDAWIAHQQKGAAFAAPAPTPAAPAGRRAAAPPPAATSTVAEYVGFDRAKQPAYTVPQTPIHPDIKFDTALVGDPARGMQLVVAGACQACHTIKGTTASYGIIGPNLTHVGSRLTIGGGLFPNDKAHLGSWVKNSGLMKPGSKMTTFGAGQLDMQSGKPLSGGLSDQQIADIVAYLQALK